MWNITLCAKRCQLEKEKLSQREAMVLEEASRKSKRSIIKNNVLGQRRKEYHSENTFDR